MDAKRKESMSIMKKIMIAMVTGILLGVVCLWLRESLTAGGNEGTWKLINRIESSFRTSHRKRDFIPLDYSISYSSYL